MFSGLGSGLGLSLYDPYLNQQAQLGLSQLAAQNYWAQSQQPMPAGIQNAVVNHNPDEHLLVLLTEE